MQEKLQTLINVLKKFQKAGMLNDFVLIGSWCLYFYKEYFINSEFNPTIRTKDLDLLTPSPTKISKKVDLWVLLKENGFLVTFDNNGYLRLEHPELMIEFLVMEKGKEEALLVLRKLIESGEVSKIVELFKTIPKSWGKKILSVLAEEDEKIFKILNSNYATRN